MFTNIRRWTVMPKGGHFAAMEQPDPLAEDVRAFYRSLQGMRRAAAPLGEELRDMRAQFRDPIPGRAPR